MINQYKFVRIFFKMKIKEKINLLIIGYSALKNMLGSTLHPPDKYKLTNQLISEVHFFKLFATLYFYNHFNSIS